MEQQVVVKNSHFSKILGGTSLVAQGSRICLPMQETWVQSLVWEDPTGHRTAKPIHPNDYA